MSFQISSTFSSDDADILSFHTIEERKKLKPHDFEPTKISLSTKPSSPEDIIELWKVMGREIDENRRGMCFLLVVLCLYSCFYCCFFIDVCF